MILEEADAAAGQSAQSWSYDTMARRSDQVAAWLAGQGVLKGDAVIVMLGNQVELWETMLGIIKLGAVIMPTTTAVGPRRPARPDRPRRCSVRRRQHRRHVKFDEVSGDYGRLAVTRGEPAPDGWASLDDAYRLDVPPAEHPGTTPEDRLLLYFTSGTTSKPKLVEHTQVSYPVGHLSTMYWLGLEPGDVHLNISSPGWAKHAWSCFFAPWNAEATVFLYNYTRFDAAALLGVIRDNEVTSLCAPPTVWRMLINADLSGGPGRLREIIGAGDRSTPRSSSRSRRRGGLQLRDGYGQTETDGPGGQHAGVTGEGRLDGPTAAGRSRGSRGSTDRRTRLGH
jgi:acetyl-CoA synthetase